MENCIYSEIAETIRSVGAVTTGSAIYVPTVCLNAMNKRVIMGAISQYNLDAYISIKGHSLQVTEEQVSELLSDIPMMQTLEIYKMGTRAYFIFTNTPV